MVDDIPIDRGILVAAFSGAIAYLCTKEKMPIVRAVAYAFAGTMAAYYLGPNIAYWCQGHYGLDQRATYGVVFATGVGGIWILNIIVSVLERLQRRADKIAGLVLGDDHDEVNPKGGQ